MESLDELNSYLARNSYLGSSLGATLEDYKRCKTISLSEVEVSGLPHLQRWHSHISRLMAKHGMFDPQGKPLQDASSTDAKDGKQSNQSKGPKDAKPAIPARQQKQPKVTVQATQKVASVPSSASKITRFCVLDFEKTCEDREKDSTWGPQEIIEFPSVLLSTSSNDIVGQFESFVKPVVNPALTAFCSELTGITQEQVNSASSLKEVLEKHHKWLREHAPEEDKCIFVTCGDMDLKTSLPQDPNIVGEELPKCYQRWINIKKEFGSFYTQWFKKGKQARNMTDMLERLEIPLGGHHHSGIDDCRNIAKVVQRMIAEGWCPA